MDTILSRTILSHVHSLLPAAIVFGHIFFTAYLSVLVGRTLYRSYLALPPSSSTRLREPLRRGHVQLFAGLSVVSSLAAQYYGVKFSSLSYRVWATERGVELPEGSAIFSFPLGS